MRRRLFPKVKMKILEPVRLTVPEELRGRKRRAAAGAALYQVMSDLVFRTEDIDMTVLEKIITTANQRGMKARYRRSGHRRAELRQAAHRRGRSWREIPHAVYAEEPTLGVMLPNANGHAQPSFGVMSAGKVPAMINFTPGAANILSACKAADVRHRADVPRVCRAGEARAVVEEIASSVTSSGWTICAPRSA